MLHLCAFPNVPVPTTTSLARVVLCNYSNGESKIADSSVGESEMEHEGALDVVLTMEFEMVGMA